MTFAVDKASDINPIVSQSALRLFIISLTTLYQPQRLYDAEWEI